jgi:hypothetical protein
MVDLELASNDLGVDDVRRPCLVERDRRAISLREGEGLAMPAEVITIGIAYRVALASGLLPGKMRAPGGAIDGQYGVPTIPGGRDDADRG